MKPHNFIEQFSARNEFQYYVYFHSARQHLHKPHKYTKHISFNILRTSNFQKKSNSIKIQTSCRRTTCGCLTTFVIEISLLICPKKKKKSNFFQTSECSINQNGLAEREAWLEAGGEGGAGGLTEREVRVKRESKARAEQEARREATTERYLEAERETGGDGKQDSEAERDLEAERDARGDDDQDSEVERDLEAERDAAGSGTRRRSGRGGERDWTAIGTRRLSLKGSACRRPNFQFSLR